MMNWTRDSRAVTVTVPNRTALLADLAERMHRREGFAIATLNLDHVVKLSRNAAFRNAYGRHTHVTADGNPIVWLSRLSGQSDIELVPGSELVDPLAEIAARDGIPVAFVGATDASLEAAEKELRSRYPGLEIPLKIAPPMGFDPTGPAADAMIAAIASSGARLVFVALGAPKQEILVAAARGRLPAIGFLSVGAGLDFISGAQSRAPVWVRRLAAEWLWRLVGNPRRLAARYAACLLVLPGLTLRASAIRLSGQRLTQ